MTLSEPQLISPLLDGFVMGDPISEHNGICCCPAMHLETNSKYIVKIISVPASQAKLDALLLAGAFTDKESALTYFQELANDVTEEAALLQRLSRFEGFVSYEDWQVVPMEEGTGFDVYLLSPYRPTLEGLIKRNELTHLGAVNLGLDLCAALSVARRFGHIYADLQPSNIHICNDREYRIGDLGFISISSLPYASLPDKYRSSYTPNEIADAYSALNETLDTYAVGMILYQAYNDGRLPPVSMQLQPPRYADPELSEIILKACSIEPSERWQEPMQMGQALISYLQRNSVNDVPIVPQTEPEEAPVEELTAEEDVEPSTDEIIAEVDGVLDAVPLLAVTEEADEAVEETAEEKTEEEATEDTAPEEAAEDADTQASAEVAEEIVDDDTEAPSDEELPDAPPVQEDQDDDVTVILAQADDIISHELPTPVIEVPQIEITMPEEPSQAEETEEVCETPADGVEEENTEKVNEASTDAAPKKRHRGLTAFLVTISVIAVLLLGGFLFYEHYYLQVVNDIILSGTEGNLTVTLDSTIADEKLTILCTDIYGNTMRRPVVNGTASFEGLKPGTSYTLQVRIAGFHKLLGKTVETYTTAPQTVIGNFVAATGPEDGSVILSFTVQGPDTNQWQVHYEAADEPARTATFTGHMVTLTGLTVGKEYTFTLEPVLELYVSGTDSIRHVASEIVYAQNLQILGIHNDALHVTWTAPEGISVSEWTVRCYNDTGYDHTFTTKELTAVFENVDPASAYTVEVTAAGMTVGARTYLSANSITFQEILVEAPDRNHLSVQWSYEGTAPEGGWLLLYSIGMNTEQKVVKCDETSGIITPLIPGAHYTITVQPANGVTVFDDTVEFDAPEAPGFSGYWVNAEDILFDMCITPDVENWDRFDVANEDYTTTFKVGSSASFVMHLTREYTTSDDEIITLFVVRDREGKIISNATETRTWSEMWYRGYGKLTLPFLPTEPGGYTVWIYFNGTAATSRSFEVVAADIA